ncbi:DUF5067 domain-containing protein [Lysinibacillus sp. NPDC093216]|uniref:DUF5067 domain-containing protein n=1 Tax=Lysinibacillus sp. NPDC093216 TaxID=3390576 RepID=UPI003CFFA5BE
MKKKLIFSAALVLSLGLAGCGADSSKDEKPKEETKTASTDKTADKETKSGDVYFKDNEVKRGDLKITITETKVIPVGEKGNERGETPVFAIWYSVTNQSDKEVSPGLAWQSTFTAIQGDPNADNKLGVGFSPDDRFKETEFENIKKDETVENVIAYDLKDLETPVILVAIQGYEGKELGKKEFAIK